MTTAPDAFRIREAVASLRPDIVVFEARLPPVSSPP